MEDSKAQAKYIRMSPRKIQQVLALIRGKRVEDALNILHFIQKNASNPVEKVLRSAVANVIQSEGSGKIDVDNLIVKNARADRGPVLRRFRPRAMGRATRIRKRTCHITLVVGEPLFE